MEIGNGAHVQDHLANRCESQAWWRDQMATKFPDDPRNEQSAWSAPREWSQPLS
jgi:hypothetical protein